MPRQVDKKLILGFDLDGVILDFTDLKLQLAKEGGFKLKPNQTPSEIIKYNIPADVWNNIKPRLYKEPILAQSLPLMKDAEKTIQKIKKLNIPYYLISRRGRGQGAIETKLAIETLQRHKLWPEYFNKSNAFFVATPEDKNKYAKKLGINLYLDDELTVLEKMGNVQTRILFDQFKVFKNSPFAQITSWKEYEKKFLKKEKGFG